MIFIKGNVPSSKNGRRWTGKYFIGSKATVRYYKESKAQWVENKEEFLKMIEGKEKPLTIGFHFVRGSKHQWDVINPLQTIQDLMVTYGWLEDDNTDIMLPVPLIIDDKYHSYDKVNPGVYIELMYVQQELDNKIKTTRARYKKR